MKKILGIILLLTLLTPSFVLADTLTVYPEAGTGGDNNTCDGVVTYQGDGTNTFSYLVSGPGDRHNDTDDYFSVHVISHGTGSGDWFRIGRAIVTLDTSALTSDATISAATFSLYPYSTNKTDNTGWKTDINIYSSNPASNNELVDGDYDSLGTTAYSTAIDYDDWGTGAYENFSFNSTGKSAISKTGITKLGARSAKYDVANSSPSLGSGSDNYTSIYSYPADEAGTSKDPKLVITYTLPTTRRIIITE